MEICRFDKYFAVEVDMQRVCSQLCHGVKVWSPLSRLPSYPFVVAPRNRIGIMMYSFRRPGFLNQVTSGTSKAPWVRSGLSVAIARSFSVLMVAIVASGVMFGTQEGYRPKKNLEKYVNLYAFSVFPLANVDPVFCHVACSQF